MSSPPRYHSTLPQPPPASSHYASQTQPSRPTGQPPIAARLPSGTYSEISFNTYATPSPPRSSTDHHGGPDEFGAGGTHQSSSTSRRPLPAQPSAGLPTNPYPSSQPSSLGRRALPTPPTGGSPDPTRQGGAPLPPPRPSGRVLPVIHGNHSRVPSVTKLPPVPTEPARPLPPAVYDPPPASRYDSPSNYSPSALYDSYLEDTSRSATPSQDPYSRLAPSRHVSQSHPTHESSSSISDAQSGWSSSLHDGRSYETGPTTDRSHESHSKHDLYDPEGTGTNVTLRAPSIRGPASSEYGSNSNEGRRTPTQSSWNQAIPNIAQLAIDPRKRTVSSTSSAAADTGLDAGLPATPVLPPQRTLEHQRSFLSERVPSSGSAPLPPLPTRESEGPSVSTVNSSGQSTLSSRDASLIGGSSRQQSFDPIDRDHRRQPSVTSSINPSIASTNRRRGGALSPSWTQQSQAPSNWVQTKLQIHQSHVEEYYDEEGNLHREEVFDDDMDDYDDGEEEEADEVNEIRFFQPAFLSEAAVQLVDRVERRRQTKQGIAWVGSFTGRDIVNAIQGFLPDYTRDGPNDRRAALVMARSLQNQLWFVEVDWDIKPLRDSSEDVFRFMGEMEGMGEGLTSELPSGLMTMATRCYSPSCTGDGRCYAARCPYKTSPDTFLQNEIIRPSPTPSSSVQKGDWTQDVDPMVLRHMSPTQQTRQTIIRSAIESEIQYDADLTAMEKMFITGLRNADPPVITPPWRVDQFINDVFANEHELHEICRRLLDNFSIRERESPQPPLVTFVGDIFLQAAAEFRMAYPEYTGNLPQAENLIKKEMDENPEFRMYCERVVRETDRRRDIKYLITRPSTHLQRYPAVLDAILNATDQDDPDRDFLVESLASIQNLSAMSQLQHFHASKGRGPAGKLEWHDLVPEEQRQTMDKKEQKRQMQIWELIKGEMEYVADLETIDNLFVNGLRIAEKGIVIERNRLDTFLDDVFHNYRSLLEVHSYLLENLQARQLEQHPRFGMISDLILDAALNWQEAYMEYVTHYPIAKAKVQEEEAKNPKFAAFLQECLRDPASNRQDVYHFINRPIPRLLRYNLLLADILKSLKESGVSDDHPDIETIPQVMELIADLGKTTQKGVAVNESKVELWTYQHSLDGSRFGPRVVKDLDLLNPMRELIHRGKVLRQPEGTISTSWTELSVLLFDNYLVLAKPEKQSRSTRREDKRVRYVINRRPIPLELLNLGNFSEPPRTRTKTKLLGGGGSSHDPGDGSTDPQDAKTVWPFTISFIGQGQLGGQYTLWTDTVTARADWQEKLLHAKVLRNEVNDANKVFDMTPLSVDTFFMATNYAVPSKDGENPFTGRVTCSVPFHTVDGRSLVAVGCDEGVWIGLRHDPRSLRKVLHVKAVTNIAVLEEFGIFLVLQDRSLLAYHLEALVPSASSPQVRAAPQRLSPGKDIVFFTVGQLSGRTLVLYMKRKGMDSLFRVLEPILGRNAEESGRQRRPFGNLLGQRTEWFRLYKDFFIPTEALGVHFLKHKLAVVCTKGFEIMDLTDLKGGSIPIFDPAKVREKHRLADLQRKCEGAKPLGMFRSTETEFLLCYDSFGIYVDRHGEPNRDCLAIEWEGRPDSVAFHPPYLLLCSAPFIEIRHIDTAKLIQIYTGREIRLTWDGTGGQARPPVDNPGPNGYGDETSSQEPRIHICKRADDVKRIGGRQAIGQNVFELTPTLALNNPLLNPVHTHDSNYFPPAPLMSHHSSSSGPPPMSPRASSVMTTSTGEGFYANMNMTNGAAPANGYHRRNQSRSDVSWESNPQYRQGPGW